MKNVILCADDYGQNPAISQAIIALIQNNRLTATTCMVNSDYWQIHAKWLLPYVSQIGVGLHLNLTEGKPLSALFKARYGNQFFTLKGLLVRAFFKKIDRAAIESEIDAQIDRFVEAVGVPPAFVDGHQHVHHLPVVRDALLSVYEKRLRNHRAFIRSVYRSGFHSFKNAMIQLTGAKAFKILLDERNIPHNTSFTGVYDFGVKVQYAALFPRFLQEVNEGGVIMCHPGLTQTTDADPILVARVREYAYLSGDAFLNDCKKYQVKITK